MHQVCNAKLFKYETPKKINNKEDNQKSLRYKSLYIFFYWSAGPLRYPHCCSSAKTHPRLYAREQNLENIVAARICAYYLATPHPKWLYHIPLSLRLSRIRQYTYELYQNPLGIRLSRIRFRLVSDKLNSIPLSLRLSAIIVSPPIVARSNKYFTKA